MVKIRTGYTPLRMIAGQKEPVILEIGVRNDENETKLVSVLVYVPFSLGFDLVGLDREARHRLGNINPGEEKTVALRVFGKHNISEGSYNIRVTVQTHPGRFDKVEKTYAANAPLRVILR